MESKKLSRRVIFFVEGEEESAGVGSRRLLQHEGERILEDSKVVLIPDGGTLSEGLECITVGLRGSASFTVSIKGCEGDLHSGIFGGLVPNPVFDAAKIVCALDSKLYDKIPGFLDGFESPSSDELSECQISPDLVNNLNFNSKFKNYHHLQLERNILTLGLFPRIEVCGVGGGYFGEGFKNIIPSSVKLKVSLRLAYNQNSRSALESVTSYISNLPLECDIEFESKSVGSNPIKISIHNPQVQWLKTAITTVTGNPVAFQWWGASIPIVEDFCKLGLTPLIFGFGLPEDNIHGPNESFSFSQWRKGHDVVQFMLSS